MSKENNSDLTKTTSVTEDTTADELVDTNIPEAEVVPEDAPVEAPMDRPAALETIPDEISLEGDEENLTDTPIESLDETFQEDEFDEENTQTAELESELDPEAEVDFDPEAETELDTTESLTDENSEDNLVNMDSLEFDTVEHVEPVAEDDISNKYQSELDDIAAGSPTDDFTKNNNNQSVTNSSIEAEKPEVDNSLSKIAASNTGNIALIAIGLIVILVIVYNSYKASKKQSAPTDPAGINAELHTISPPPPSASDQIAQPQMPKLPETPQIQIPIVVQGQKGDAISSNGLTPPSLPTVPGLGAPAIPPIVNQEGTSPIATIPPSLGRANLPPTAPTGAAIAKSTANKGVRYKTNMMTFGGGAGGGPGSAAVMSKTSSQVTATIMGDLTKLIAQGKIIDGVLESAISTDLPGMVRAIVARDTYAESGKNILIPKGSRLVGTYSASVQNGQARVQITWTRMMRPDGIDIAINSPSVDSVGRTGVVGSYEGRGLEQFTSALMVSALNYGMAALQDKQNQKEGVSNGGSVIVGGQSIPNASVSNPGGSGLNSNTVITTNPTTQKSQALTTASSQISSVAQTLANNYYQVQPRITIDQGAKIKVFVQYDLVFPGQAYNSINVVN